MGAARAGGNTAGAPSAPLFRTALRPYIRLLPVVLVTVAHQGAGDMVPMDLIGLTDPAWLSMASRSTSPAVRPIEQSRLFPDVAAGTASKLFEFPRGYPQTCRSLSGEYMAR